MFECGHGTSTTQAEFNDAMDWAADKYPDKVLADTSFTCWILAYRAWKAAQPARKEVKAK